MLHRAFAALGASLGPHLDLSKGRAETLAPIVVALVSARTVHLSHLAAERPGTALIASSWRRLQRFFRHVRLGPDWAAPLTAELVGLRGSRACYLTLDRTEGRIGGASGAHRGRIGGASGAHRPPRGQLPGAGRGYTSLRAHP